MAKDMFLTMTGKMYSSALRSSILHGNETWPIMKQLEKNPRTNTEMWMVRWMYDKQLCDRVPSTKLRDRLGIENISTVLQRNRLRWFGRAQRTPDNEWTKRCMEYRKLSGPNCKGR